MIPHPGRHTKNRSVQTVRFPAAGVPRGRGAASAAPPAIGGGRGGLTGMRIDAPPLGGASTAPGGPPAPKHSSLCARARAGVWVGGFGGEGEGFRPASTPVGQNPARPTPFTLGHATPWAKQALRSLRIDSEDLSGLGLYSYTPRLSGAPRIDPEASQGNGQPKLFISVHRRGHGAK